MVAQNADKIIEIRIEDVEINDKYNPRKTAHRETVDPHAVEQYCSWLDFSEPPPILINQDYELLDGVHRRAAAIAAGRETIMALVVDTGERDGQDLLEATLPNIWHGKRLSSNEQRNVAVKLLRMGWSEEELATKFKVSEVTIRRWKSKTVSSLALAYEALPKDQRPTITEYAKDNDLSFEQARKAIEHIRKGETNENLKARCKHVAYGWGKPCVLLVSSKQPSILAYKRRVLLLRFMASKTQESSELKRCYKNLEVKRVKYHYIREDSDFEALLREVTGVSDTADKRYGAGG